MTSSSVPSYVRIPHKTPLLTPTLGFSESSAHHLQRQVGNRAVGKILGDTRAREACSAIFAPATSSQRNLRRMPLEVENRPGEKHETLHNTKNSAGLSAPKTYQLGKQKIDMSRSGTPEVVTVTVKTLFMHQPRTPNADGKLPEPAPIPEGDERRTWAITHAPLATAKWNGHLEFRGSRPATGTPPGTVAPAPSASPTATPTVLKVNFKSEPIFDLAKKPEAHTAVALNGPEVEADPKAGQPVDAGHFYLNATKNYGTSTDAIYAHEYGHWIGLADEYSMSNPQAHALLHRVSPGGKQDKLDSSAVEKMVMASLASPLEAQLEQSAEEIAAALGAGKELVAKNLHSSIETAVNSASLTPIMPQLALADPALAPQTHANVEFAKTVTLGDRTLVPSVLNDRFATPALHKTITSAYASALDTSRSGWIETDAGYASVSAAKSVSLVTAGTPGSTAAKNVVGEASGSLPPIRPSSSLVSALKNLPNGWKNLHGAALPTVTAGNLVEKLEPKTQGIKLMETLGLGPVLGEANQEVVKLQIMSALRSSVIESAGTVLDTFANEQIAGKIKAGVDQLSAMVKSEVAAAMAIPAGAHAAKAPKHPNLAALAADAKVRLEAAAAAQTSAKKTADGDSDLSPGSSGPAQEVTYSMNNMMSNNAEVFRPDQFSHLLSSFNANFLKPGESAFTLKVL
jgi:hypothetical protein